MKRLLVWYKALSSGGKAGVILATFIGMGIVGAAGQNPSNNTQAKPAPSHASSPSVTTKNVTQTKPIAFMSTTVQDGTLSQGTSKVTTQGVKGLETLTYKDTYNNGKLTDHKLVGDDVTTKPVAQVTSIGTYVAPEPAPTCTNGTYVNSIGNTVCSPETSPSPPAGATAQCVDGIYSFSQSRSGTCSHHGGVSVWY